MLKIGFIGSGKMAQALAKGFVASGELKFIKILFKKCSIIFHF
jgi:pyrroline-5-carboxylate reductase